MRRANTQTGRQRTGRSLATALRAPAAAGRSRLGACARWSSTSDGPLTDRAPAPVLTMGLALVAWLCAALLAATLVAGRAAADTPAANGEPAALSPGAEAPVPAAPAARDLDRLLLVPATHARRDDARSADEAIAAAVRLGNGDRYVPQSGFRKRNLDLFRSEHPVEIGQQEMLLRLRLRARTRDAMSVELRF